jgi:hypothetical protein
MTTWYFTYEQTTIYLLILLLENFHGPNFAYFLSYSLT